MKRSTLSILLSVILLTSCGTKSNQDDSKEIAEDQNEEKFDDSSIEKDTEFAVDVADGGMLEVQLAQLALSNASSAEVKKFAQTMIDDHGKANDELKALAQQKGISLPASLSDKCQKKYNDLVDKKGAEFDKEYMDLMVKEHKDTIDKFKKEADKGNDGDLKTWAAAKVPVLEHHLEMAQATQDLIKNKKDTRS